MFLKRIGYIMCLLAITIVIVPKDYWHHHCENENVLKEHSSQTKIQKSTACSICDLHFDHFVAVNSISMVLIEVASHFDYAFSIPKICSLHPIFSNKGPPVSVKF